MVQVAVETTKTMSDLSPYPPHSRRPFDYWALVIIGMCCLALMVWLKTLGVILSLGIIAALYWAFKLRTSAPEAISLQRSIDLSRADIVDVVDAFERFRDSGDAEAIADRTLQRPELNNPNSTDPDIESFYIQLATARRFLQRLDIHLMSASTTEELESLLAITDKRAFELNQSWIKARRAAVRFKRG